MAGYSGARVNYELTAQGANRKLYPGPATDFYDPASKRLSDYERVLFNSNIEKGMELPRRGGFRVGQGSPVVSTAPAVTVGSPYPPNPTTLPAIRQSGGVPDTSRFARGFTMGEAYTPGAEPPAVRGSTSLVDPTPTPRAVRAGLPAVGGVRALNPVLRMSPTPIVVDPQGGVIGRTASAIQSGVSRDFALQAAPSEQQSDPSSIYGRDTGLDRFVRKVAGFIGNKNSVSGSKAPTYVDDPYGVADNAVPTSKPVRNTPNVVLDSPGASTPMTSEQMVAATPLPKGFGTQRDQDVIRTLPVPETPVMSQAENNALTEGREAFAENKRLGETRAANEQRAQDRISELRQTIASSVPSEYDRAFVGKADMSNPSYRNMLATTGVYADKVKAAQAELASITGQQDKALKASEIEADITKENIQGGFKLREQALRNEGVVAQENVRGGFNVKSRDLDLSQVEENTARALLITKQAEGTLSKKEQLELNASNKQAEIIQTQKKLGADAYTKTMAETGDPLKAADAQMAVEAALSGDQFIPGTQAQKGTFRFGFGKPEIKATPGRVVKKEAPPVAGAARAPDGKWYVSDPKRPGKYLQVGV